METERIFVGRQRIGSGLVGPRDTVRFPLPRHTTTEETDRLLFMVHIVWTDDKKSDVPVLPSDQCRPAARLRFYINSEAVLSKTDRHQSRCIGTRRCLYPSPATYKTESLWLPVRGRHLFVQNMSRCDEARVTITTLAVVCKSQAMSSSDPEEEHIYAELEALAPPPPVRSDSLATSLWSLSSATPSASSSSSICTCSSASPSSDWFEEETFV